MDLLYFVSNVFSPVMGGGFCSGLRGCRCSKWCWTVPFCLPAGGFGLGPLRSGSQSAYLRVFNGRGGAACSRGKVRCRWPWFPFVRVDVGAPGHRARRHQWALPRGESRFTPPLAHESRQSLVAFCGACAHPHRTLSVPTRRSTGCSKACWRNLNSTTTVSN